MSVKGKKQAGTLAQGDSAQSRALALLRQVQLFPVRHHSPRAAMCLQAMLQQQQPELILIEGPSDASHLNELLTDAGTEPPVAILAYVTDGKPQSVLWPFASYSPEFLALRYGAEQQIPTRFIDLPAGVVLAQQSAQEAAAEAAQKAAQEDAAENASETAPEAGCNKETNQDGTSELISEMLVDGGPTADAADPTGAPDVYQQLAECFGLRHFDEFWDCYFESPHYAHTQYITALNAYAELVTEKDAPNAPQERDSLMAQAILQAIESGIEPNKIVVVLGAAHVAALWRGAFSLQPVVLPTPKPCALTVIPFSYPRLSEQSGYGAGNRAPWFYERAFAEGLDYTRAALRVLLEFSASLRLRGFVVSLADVIEAYRLSTALAAIRAKSCPGLDEIADAAQATLTRGESAPIQQFLAPLLIGQRIGRLTAKAGQNALQQEFSLGLKHFGLPRTDASEVISLRLTDSKHTQASQFLHRLRVADIPYAGYAGSQSVVSKNKVEGDVAGGFAAFNRVREHWTVQWTPATEIALMERVIYGDNLTQVCQRRLTEMLNGCTQVELAANVLVDAVLTDASLAINSALDVTERLSSLDDLVASLAAAARTLSGLSSYGHSRPTLKQLVGTIERLLLGTFTRAVLRLPAACVGTAEATLATRQAMRILHELALSQTQLDRAAWFAALAAISLDGSLDPNCSGVATALLYLAQELDDEQLTATLDQRLADTITPMRAADFLAGFFAVNALVLLKNAEVVQALSRFLCALPMPVFKDVLPALRRAFAELGASERRYLLEHLIKAHAAAETATAVAVVSASDTAALADLSRDLDAALGDLGDLL